MKHKGVYVHYTDQQKNNQVQFFKEKLRNMHKMFRK